MAGRTFEIETVTDKAGYVHLDIGEADLKVRVSVTIDQAQPRSKKPLTRAPTAKELLLLPIEEQDRILEEQFARAELLYRTDPDLREMLEFEALDDEDFFDEYPDEDTTTDSR